MSAVSATNIDRRALAMIVPFMLVACVGNEPDPAPLLRRSSAQSGESAEELACQLAHFAMPFCGGRNAQFLDEGACEDGDKVEYLYFETIGNLLETVRGLGSGQFVGRLFHEEGVTYANDVQVFSWKAGSSFGIVPAVALCDIARGATFRPTQLEIGFRNAETGYVTPITALDVKNFPVPVSQTTAFDCSTATYEPSKRVTWDQEPRACSPDEVWTEPSESLPKLQLEPEDDATYYAEPTCFVWDDELGRCTDANQEIARVTFGSGDSIFFKDLAQRLRGYVEEGRYTDPDFDVYANVTVFVDSDGTTYRGDAFLSVWDELVPTETGAEGYVPTSHFDFGPERPSSDTPVSLSTLIVQVPDVSEEPSFWTFTIPADQTPAMWHSE